MNDVFIVDANRTPQAKAGLDFKNVAAPFLGIPLLRHIMDKVEIPDDGIDEVIIGNIGTPAKYPNISRVIALDAGLHEKTSAYTVNRNCASGMEAVSQGFLKIKTGRASVVLAGGVESMSQMPLIFNRDMTELFSKLMSAKTLPDRIKALVAFRPYYLSPVIAIEQGLTDPFSGLNMGQTAELLARELNITREEQDIFANESHKKATIAWESNRIADEVVPIIAGSKLEKLITKDIGYRSNSSVEGLAKMKPYFDKKSGTVTVGNSCPITDGGSMLLLANEESVKKYNLRPMAKVIDYFFGGLAPERMGMGPLIAMNGLLERTAKKIEDVDLFEINEAFAAQVLAVLRGMKDGKVASRFGINRVWGEIPYEKLNVNGGAIALGHPVGSTGSRLICSLAHELRRRRGKYGVASLCIGGGQGGAVLIENLL